MLKCHRRTPTLWSERLGEARNPEKPRPPQREIFPGCFLWPRFYEARFRGGDSVVPMSRNWRLWCGKVYLQPTTGRNCNAVLSHSELHAQSFGSHG
jgi:hypothetical protein